MSEYSREEKLAYKAGARKAEQSAQAEIDALRKEVVGLGDQLALKLTRNVEGQAASARILWAQLGVTNHTEASMKVANLLAQRELIERLEARIVELKERDEFE